MSILKRIQFVDMTDAEAADLHPRRDERRVYDRFLASAIRIATSTAGRASRRQLEDTDEIDQAALVGIHKAITTWEPSRGAWYPHAKITIGYAVSNAMFACRAERDGHSSDQMSRAVRMRREQALPSYARTDFRVETDYAAPEEDPLAEMVEYGIVEAICMTSARYRRDSSGRLKRYIHECVLGSKAVNDFAAEHGIRRQSVALDWSKFRTEVQAAMAPRAQPSASEP